MFPFKNTICCPESFKRGNILRGQHAWGSLMDWLKGGAIGVADKGGTNHSLNGVRDQTTEAVFLKYIT